MPTVSDPDDVQVAAAASNKLAVLKAAGDEELAELPATEPTNLAALAAVSENGSHWSERHPILVADWHATVHSHCGTAPLHPCLGAAAPSYLFMFTISPALASAASIGGKEGREWFSASAAIESAAAAGPVCPRGTDAAKSRQR